MLRAFFNDPILKVSTHANIVAAREAGRLHPGGCHGEEDMRETCAIAVTAQSKTPRHGDFPTKLGLPRILAEIEEVLFESLEIEKALMLPERIVEAIGVGADLSNIGWLLLHTTLLEHEGGKHRLVAKTVAACAAVIEPLVGGKRADSIDALALAEETNRLLTTVLRAAGTRSHPAYAAVVLAGCAVRAAAKTPQRAGEPYNQYADADSRHNIVSALQTVAGFAGEWTSCRND